jgi:hypothetical protein
VKTKLRTRAMVALLASSGALLATSGGLVTWAHPDPVADEGAHEASDGMAVKLTTRPAPGGVLVRLRTRRFRWAPEHLSPVHGEGRFVPGEGHGHIYVDRSVMPAIMVVGPWTYLRLEPGRHLLRVTLNGNDHLVYRRNGRPVQDSVSATVGEMPKMEG